MTVMIAAFSITPLGGGESVGASVAEAVRLVRQSGLPNETNAMFTNVEGEWDEVMSLIREWVMKVSETAPRGECRHQDRPPSGRDRGLAAQGRIGRAPAGRAVGRDGPGHRICCRTAGGALDPR
jgi:uncharacterized protein YqgV (UPF0045/DUF77 family)